MAVVRLSDVISEVLAEELKSAEVPAIAVKRAKDLIPSDKIVEHGPYGKLHVYGIYDLNRDGCGAHTMHVVVQVSGHKATWCYQVKSLVEYIA